MISFNYETNFSLDVEFDLSNWVAMVIHSEGFKEGEINYIFCDDKYLLRINKAYLNHDTLTDIISFDYTTGKEIHGDIYISVERVIDNAKEFQVEFFEELKRVMVHGVLHYCGYKDKTQPEIELMRAKEDFYINKAKNL